MEHFSEAGVRCGIVLAAGEGKRLQPFIRRMREDDLPKQYVNFIGDRSMLEHTIHRAEKLIPSERLFTVVSRDHLRYPEVRKQLSGRAPGTVIVQPENKDTGPGIFLPLAYLYKKYPEATVAVFPSDHFILEEDSFMAYVALAFSWVDQNPSSLVLLGVKPHKPEPEYGYIVPEGTISHQRETGLRWVRKFVEKPDSKTSQDLILQGALWNTMVMVFKAATLWDLARKVAPSLHRPFEQIREAIGGRDEKKVIEAAYRGFRSVNFSSVLLEGLSVEHSSSLTVLPVEGVLWSDWGSAGRIIGILRKIGYLSRLNRRLNRIPETGLFGIWEESRF